MSAQNVLEEVGRSPSYMPQKCGWRLSLSKKHLSPAPDPRKEKKALVSDCQAFFCLLAKKLVSGLTSKRIKSV